MILLKIGFQSILKKLTYPQDGLLYKKHLFENRYLTFLSS